MTTKELHDIGARIRSYRLQRDLTQHDLGKRVGKSKQLVSAWEAGRAEMMCSTLARVSQVLAVDPAWILGIAKGKNPETLPSRPEGSIVPLLDAAQTVLLANGKLEMVKTAKRVSVHTAVSDQAFALQALDNGLWPVIEKGDLIVVDRDAEIVPAGIVLAVIFFDQGDKLKIPVVTAREVRFSSMNAPRPPYQLVPTKLGYPVVAARHRKEAMLLGPVVGIFKKLGPTPQDVL
jgi:transcriptional regulator with XRE-family HTH domain